MEQKIKKLEEEMFANMEKKDILNYYAKKIGIC